MISYSKMIDDYSFALGMATAFCECVAAESKNAAFSQPLQPSFYDTLREDMEQLAAKHKVRIYYEPSLDLPEKERLCWWVIYTREDILAEYLELRATGCQPVKDLRPFYNLLSYKTAQKM